MAGAHFLVAGLGNITHPLTRHSIGHYVVDALSTRLNIHLSNSRTGYGASANVDIGQHSITLTLFKPKALMNISGQPIVQRLRETVHTPNNLIVIHDSLDHKPCALSPKFGGSANGHNGVRSIISALGNGADFHRLRLGIGRDGESSEYVLTPLSRDERKFWGATGAGSDLIWRELVRIIEKRLKA